MQMRTVLAFAFVVGLVSLVAASPALAEQEIEPADPLAVVETFLVARDTGDALGAAMSCANLLELQDVDGQWFIDPPGVTDWVRQLTNKYHIDRLTPLVVEGRKVSWTERLRVRTLPYPESLRSSTIIEVHASIRDGRIAYLSGAYPPIPFRVPAPAAAEGAMSDAGRSAVAAGPGTLFLGSALALTITALLAARGGPLLAGVTQRRPHRDPSQGGRQH